MCEIVEKLANRQQSGNMKQKFSNNTKFEQKVKTLVYSPNFKCTARFILINSTDASYFLGCCHCFQLFDCSTLSVNCWFLQIIKIHFDGTIGQFFVFLFHALQFYREHFELLCRYGRTYNHWRENSSRARHRGKQSGILPIAYYQSAYRRICNGFPGF